MTLSQETRWAYSTMAPSTTRAAHSSFSTEGIEMPAAPGGTAPRGGAAMDLRAGNW